MKMTPSKSMAAWAVVTACLIAIPAFASKAPQVESLKKNLKAVPVLEMPAAAARLVSTATTDEREATATAVTQAAAELRPAAIVSVVGAVVRALPESASTIAATAAAKQPKQAGAIAKAAAAAAPGQAAKIVWAVCKQVPTKYNDVAIAVFQAVPGAGKEILGAVSLAVPSLKAFVDRASTDSSGRTLPVPTVIAETEQLVSTAAVAQRVSPEKLLTPNADVPKFEPMPLMGPPPVVGPPFTTPAGTPTEMSRTNVIIVPPGQGRNYAGP